MLNITLLDPIDPIFPAPHTALNDPNGLLAIGGNLQPDTLLSAYRKGIFPWFSSGEPILWWSPDPRAVIYPEHFHASRSLLKLARQGKYQVTFDCAFEAVMAACSEPRKTEADTWITDSMQLAYCELHALGHAHSVEIWHQGQLVGGLYGVKIGALFCGESMFSRTPNTSKLALFSLLTKAPDIQLIDCQLPNAHLESLGAETISREKFLDQIALYGQKNASWPGTENSDSGLCL